MPRKKTPAIIPVISPCVENKPRLGEQYEQQQAMKKLINNTLADYLQFFHPWKFLR